MSDEVYVKGLQKKVDALELKREKLEYEVRKIDRQISELKAGQSPIKPGDLIEFESGNKLRRAKVISVRWSYCGFEYRCHIVNKAGKQVGYANVPSSKMPMLIGGDK